MWRAWLTGRPVLQTVRLAGTRGLADTSKPRTAQAAVAAQAESRELKPSGKQQWKVCMATWQAIRLS